MIRSLIENLRRNHHRLGIQRQLGDSMPTLDSHQLQSMAEGLSFTNHPNDIVDVKLDDPSENRFVVRVFSNFVHGVINQYFNVR